MPEDTILAHCRIGQLMPDRQTLEKLGYRVSPLKVTQHHQKWHRSIGYLRLPASDTQILLPTSI